MLIFSGLHCKCDFQCCECFHEQLMIASPFWTERLLRLVCISPGPWRKPLQDGCSS
ncbi:hypothetical protein KC19_4G071100 [Ceratodon purpureus]|uniref:Uncharacterized protein n=1 Tax=Ceratodon purpureus TaxID=3225 RepID=A0A8T0I7K7_CERPU|nr:hypothetical protein KC19_4G071100 [Ceratodon purpureus]